MLHVTPKIETVENALVRLTGFLKICKGGAAGLSAKEYGTTAKKQNRRKPAPLKIILLFY